MTTRAPLMACFASLLTCYRVVVPYAVRRTSVGGLSSRMQRAMPIEDCPSSPFGKRHADSEASISVSQLGRTARETESNRPGIFVTSQGGDHLRWSLDSTLQCPCRLPDPLRERATLDVDEYSKHSERISRPATMYRVTRAELVARSRV